METITVKGMSCQHCVGSVKKALEELDGLSEVNVDLDAGKASYINKGVSRKEIREAISRIGFEPGE